MKKFYEAFGNTPVLGMIHLAGRLPVKRALDEIRTYSEEGLDGAIIQNYHGCAKDVEKILKEQSRMDHGLILGVNIIPNEFEKSIPLADQYGCDFVQVDNIAGKYVQGRLNFSKYNKFRKNFSDILVFGGVWSKGYQPVKGSDLEEDLNEATERADAVVVTGPAKNKPTPINKINDYRKCIGEVLLIVGSGLRTNNAYDRLKVAEGGFVGSYFKVKNKTWNNLDVHKIRDFMDVVKEIRDYKTR